MKEEVKKSLQSLLKSVNASNKSVSPNHLGELRDAYNQYTDYIERLRPDRPVWEEIKTHEKEILNHIDIVNNSAFTNQKEYDIADRSLIENISFAINCLDK